MSLSPSLCGDDRTRRLCERFELTPRSLGSAFANCFSVRKGDACYVVGDVDEYVPLQPSATSGIRVRAVLT